MNLFSFYFLGYKLVKFREKGGYVGENNGIGVNFILKFIYR